MSAVFKPRCRILLVDARSLNSDLAVCQETRSGLPAMMQFPQVSPCAPAVWGKMDSGCRTEVHGRVRLPFSEPKILLHE